MKILNLYSGLGGNRKLWTGHNITSIEHNNDLARQYSEFYPEDNMIIGDAKSFLLKHYSKFDFIWASPPCQSHSITSCAQSPTYIDLTLYQIVIFLRAHYKGKWIVENVNPYYTPIINHSFKIGRNIFFSNFTVSNMTHKIPDRFIHCSTEELKEYLGIHYKKNIYTDKSHCPKIVLRNCVHPDIGQHILQCIE